MSDDIATSTTHKGVGIHAGQPARRVALVKREIDKVARITDLEELLRIAGDCSWAPEARLFAEARCIAGLQIATERRQAHPDIDKEAVVAAAAGLTSRKWQSQTHFCTLLDAPENAARRDEPLLDDDDE